MLKTVLVPLDGSPFGEHAIPLARSIMNAAPAGSELMLHLVHVHVPVTKLVMGDVHAAGIPIVDEEIDAESRKREKQYLEWLRTSLRGMGNIQIRCAVLDGMVSETLVEYAEMIKADLIVMTTHGRGGMARLWLGSVADAVLRNCCVPVLLLRPQEGMPKLDQSYDLQQIVVPLDGSVLAEQALMPARELGEMLNARYTLLQVIEPVHVGGYVFGMDAEQIDREIAEHRQAEAHEYLDTIARQFQAEDNEVDTLVCVAQQVSLGILEAARQRNAKMIVLATHGHGGLRRMLLGSVADKLVRTAQIPVLLYHPIGKKVGDRAMVAYQSQQAMEQNV